MSLFDEMLKSEHYQNLLSKLPNDEREELIKSLREFVETFEKSIIRPIENYKPKSNK